MRKEAVVLDAVYHVAKYGGQGHGLKCPRCIPVRVDDIESARVI